MPFKGKILQKRRQITVVVECSDMVLNHSDKFVVMLEESKVQNSKEKNNADYR